MLIILVGLAACATASVATTSIAAPKPTDTISPTDTETAIPSGTKPIPEDAIQQVCAGGTLVGVAAYKGGVGPHPILLVSSSFPDQDTLNDQVPNTWLPVSLENLELVACIGGRQEEIIDACQYIGGPNIDRIVFTLNIRVVEALTGNLVIDNGIRGSYPPDCPDRAPVEMTRQTGTDVTAEDVLSWLPPIVMEGRLPLITLPGGTAYFREIVWSPDGTKVAAIDEKGKLSIWDARNNILLNTLQNHVTSIAGADWGIDWSPDGKWIVSAGADGKVLLTDVQTFETRVIQDFGEYQSIGAVAWSPDGKSLFASSRPMTIWDTQTWTSMTLQADNIHYTDAAWSPTGNILAVAGADVLVLDGNTRQWLAPIYKTSSGETTYSIDWSPDGQALAVGTETGINIWDFNKQKIITNLKGHLRSVDSLDWSPDGSKLASGSTWDGSIYIWDIPKGTQADSMHFKNVDCLAWSPDGKTLAIGAGNDMMLWTNP